MDAALKEEKNYTINDIYSLPDGERAELFDGQIYYMTPPSWTHQRISRKLQQAIANYIDNSNGSCEVLAAPFAVFLNDEDLKTYLEPDLSVICDRKKLDDKGCHGAPDWVIEIVSPMSRSRDYIKKMITYHMAGVRERNTGSYICGPFYKSRVLEKADLCPRHCSPSARKECLEQRSAYICLSCLFPYRIRITAFTKSVLLLTASSNAS